MKKEVKKAAIIHSNGERGSLREPTQQFTDFINFYLDGMEPQDAWIAAGYSENTKYNSRVKLREHWRTLEKMIDERIGSHVPAALNCVVELMQRSTSDTVKLNAAKDILSRAGKDKPIQLQHSTKDPDEMDDEQLDAEIIDLAKKIGMGLDKGKDAG